MCERERSTKREQLHHADRDTLEIVDLPPRRGSCTRIERAQRLIDDSLVVPALVTLPRRDVPRETGTSDHCTEGSSWRRARGAANGGAPAVAWSWHVSRETRPAAIRQRRVIPTLVTLRGVLVARWVPSAHGRCATMAIVGRPAYEVMMECHSLPRTVPLRCWCGQAVRDLFAHREALPCGEMWITNR